MTLFAAETDLPTASPFLKYPGTKKATAVDMIPLMPTRFGAYYEAFLGGGAVFWTLANRLHRGRHPAHLSDAGQELMKAYAGVRDDVEGVIAGLHECRYDREEFYRRRSEDWATLSPTASAIRSIFLNRTCFNGLFRVNRKGQFNVPFGKYTDPTICQVDKLRACSAVLQGTATLESRRFEQPWTDTIEKGDLAYFDPPYLPASATSNFTAYTPEGFKDADQVALADLCRRLVDRGVYVMASNADVPRARELYTGFRIEKTLITRPINAHAEKRGVVGEVLICGGF